MLNFVLSFALAAPVTAAPTAKRPTAKTPAPVARRVYIPDDNDPCDFERFKLDPGLRAWMERTAPATASTTLCWHRPANVLNALSTVLRQLDEKKLRVVSGPAELDARALALTGYQADAIIRTEREGRTETAVLFRGGAGATVGHVLEN